MIWAKGAHQSALFQTFDCLRQVSPNLYFDRLLLFKVYKTPAKKVQRNYVSWDWRVMQIWGKTDLLFQKRKRSDQFWHEHPKVSKICTLIDSFCAKYRTFDFKKYIGINFHGTQEWYKIWKKPELWFGKWHEEFAKFLPEHLEVSKLGVWWDPFIQSRKYMSLKFTEELCVMTIKNDAKFEKEFNYCFKTDMGNLTNFDLSTRKRQKLALWLVHFMQSI